MLQHDVDRDWHGGVEGCWNRLQDRVFMQFMVSQVRRALDRRGIPRRSAAAQGAALKRRLVGCGMAQVRREVTPLLPVEWHRDLQHQVDAFDRLFNAHMGPNDCFQDRLWTTQTQDSWQTIRQAGLLHLEQRVHSLFEGSQALLVSHLLDAELEETPADIGGSLLYRLLDNEGRAAIVLEAYALTASRSFASQPDIAPMESEGDR